MSSSDSDSLRVVIAASEAVPWSKTGGLADVASALARALASRGAEVALFVPAHRPRKPLPPIQDTGVHFAVAVGEQQIDCAVHMAEPESKDSKLRVFFIDQPYYFNRSELYGENGRDYDDNCARFVFFSRSVLEACRRLKIQPDVVHANDWQTGLIPVLLDGEYRSARGFERTASVFTIHNLAYQGKFWHLDMQLTGVDWKYFSYRHMEAYGQLNLLKSGITLADRVTTVSPTYAREIQTSEYGCGLHLVLQFHSKKLRGILNGIDIQEWNPATDPLIPENFDVHSWESGKPRCKQKLQEAFGLPQRSDVPLVGMVSRMSTQKGFDIIGEAAGRLLQRDLQLAILGTGDPACEDLVTRLAAANPDKVAARLEFDEGLAHGVEAGADVFLMPSQYEPCGLNQMYSLMYGTLPLVRATGGLADSVVHASDENLRSLRATGFVFHDYTAEALLGAFERMLDLYGNDEAWSQMVRTGMQQDWSWDRSAAEYEAVYREAIGERDG